MTRRLPWPEAALAVVLLLAPYLLPKLEFSYDLLQRILDWGSSASVST